MKKTVIMRTLSALAIAAAASVATGCGGSSVQALTPQDVLDGCSSGVVLVKNTYYFEMELPNFSPIYFTIDDAGEIDATEFNLEELTPTTSFGTGFIISDDGYIATNCHVAHPSVDTNNVRNNFSNVFNEIADTWSEEVNELNDKISLTLSFIANTNDYRQLQELKQSYSEMYERRDELQKSINLIHNMQGATPKITLHNAVSIAYSDTHVTTYDDFIPCVNLQHDEAHDVALIQLKSKRTPEDKYIFSVPDYYGQEAPVPQVGEQLYLIGFNLGPALAITEEGVKPQVMQGAITQNTDATQIMYSIPTLGGSSGSPVIDSYGNLVAVNYAGLSMTQNFNYGIKVQHLANLIWHNN